MIHLAISLDGAGHHPAAWREPGADPQHLFDAARLVGLAQLAERALLDFVTLTDSFELQSSRPDEVRGDLDALLTMARIAPATTSIGLVPTVTTTHTEPFHVSKNLATLDLVSDGRAGWLVDVSATEAAARHFGRRSSAPVEDLHAEASEAIDVVEQLWDSWEDDAVIRDVATGRYIDRDKLHYTNFEGRFFSVRGPSITPRSPQGQLPIVVHVVDEASHALAVERADIVLIDAIDIERAAGARASFPSGVTVLVVIDVLLGATEADALETRQRLDGSVSPHTPNSGYVVTQMPDRPGSGASASTSGSASTLDFVGTAEQLADVIGAWCAAGAADGFFIRPAVLPTTLQAIVDDVVPLLQRHGTFRTTYEAETLRGRFGMDKPTNRYVTVGAEVAS
ncbi:MAG: LLM class flavin-dependent oxidoreductase [Ilumatobacteraceae bacterium]